MLIDKKYTGNITTTEDTLITGIVTGNITVTSGTTIEVTGIENGEINIDKGGYAVLKGIINGDIHNKGELEINRIISGVLQDPFSKAIISEKAIIK